MSIDPFTKKSIINPFVAHLMKQSGNVNQDPFEQDNKRFAHNREVDQQAQKRAAQVTRISAPLFSVKGVDSSVAAKDSDGFFIK